MPHRYGTPMPRTPQPRHREHLIDRLACSLRPQTLAHSLAVREQARSLASGFGADPEAAALAGLVHDCAKHLPDAAYLSMAEEAGLTLFPAERASPPVLHQRLGALRARRELEVTDKAVLSAVACHTTGHPDMDALARCLFVADYTAAGRDFPGVHRLRETLADEGAEAGFRAVLRFKRKHVARRGLPKHPWAEEAYQRFLSARDQ